MGSEEWVPPGVDQNTASIARVYDYIIGGKDNFEIDRLAGDAMIAIESDAPQIAITNRVFLRKVVQYAVREVGIRQFLDIGSGLPTQGNVHESAREIDSSVRVVYVDNDPMALAHSRALVGESDTTIVVSGDARCPNEILQNPEVRKHLDFDQPLGLLLFSILHHINDHEDPNGIAAAFRSTLAPGSLMAVSHFVNPGDGDPTVAGKVRQAEIVFNESLGTGRWRSYDELRAFFGDFEIIEPGVVPVTDWRPEPGKSPPLSPYAYSTIAGGVARKL